MNSLAQRAFTVIIPVLNKWDMTVNCLRSLKEHSCDYEYEVIVVDNGSSDTTASELDSFGTELFGKLFHRIRFEENRNFGPACNAGAIAASTPLLFFLNNDTILTPHWSPPLMQCLQDDPTLAGAGPLLLYENDTVQHLGIQFSVNSVGHLYPHFPAEHPVVKKKRYFQAITAAAFLIPKQLFFAFNGFHEEYCNGFEDVDLCLRISSSGKRFRCVAQSRIYHLESQTSGRKDAENKNAQILSKRCSRLARPDKHIFGIRDGFVPFINDYNEIALRMNPADDAKLVTFLEDQDPEKVYELLRVNPLSILLRNAVADVLEKAGEADKALSLRSESAAILGTIDAYQRVHTLACKVGNTNVETVSRATIERLSGLRSDPSLKRAIQHKVRSFHDPFLLSLYEQKFTDHNA